MELKKTLVKIEIMVNLPSCLLFTIFLFMTWMFWFTLVFFVISVKLNGNRTVIGILRGFDPFMNLVLDEALEDVSPTQKNNIGMVVCHFFFFLTYLYLNIAPENLWRIYLEVLTNYISVIFLRFSKHFLVFSLEDFLEMLLNYLFFTFFYLYF